MKKCFFVGLLISIVPVMCLGESVRFTQLVREKQRKMAELEKCMGSIKGLKIAGISTLGLSAVGVAANVVEAQKIKEYETKKTAAEKDIEKFNKEIAEIEKCENEGKEYKDGKCVVPSSNKKSLDNYDENIVGVAFLHNGTCRVYTENHTQNDVDETQCSNNLSKGSWLVTKDGKSITGDSMCASNGMNVLYVTNHSPISVGEYCWCKINFGPGASSDWILSTDAINGIPYKCENYCAHNCAYGALNNSLGFSNTPTEEKNQEKKAAKHSASEIGVGNLNLFSPNKNVDVATQRGMDAVFGNEYRLNIPVPAAPMVADRPMGL